MGGQCKYGGGGDLGADDQGGYVGGNNVNDGGGDVGVVELDGVGTDG